MSLNFDYGNFIRYLEKYRTDKMNNGKTKVDDGERKNESNEMSVTGRTMNVRSGTHHVSL